jgi:hypothetical protein
MTNNQTIEQQTAVAAGAVTQQDEPVLPLAIHGEPDDQVACNAFCALVLFRCVCVCVCVCLSVREPFLCSSRFGALQATRTPAFTVSWVSVCQNIYICVDLLTPWCSDFPLGQLSTIRMGAGASDIFENVECHRP